MLVAEDRLRHPHSFENQAKRGDSSHRADMLSLDLNHRQTLLQFADRFIADLRVVEN